MQFRLTLAQNLPNRDPSALSVTYTYGDGQQTTWPVQAIGPDRDRAVLVVDCAADLIHQPDVSTRELTSHYPVMPTTVVTRITSVQPVATATPIYQMEESMSTPYQIVIAMEQATVTALTNDHYYLYGFKAVKASGATGAPLVWFRSAHFGLKTELEWSEQYQAYTTTEQIIPRGRITATNPYDIDLDQTLNVTGTDGTGSVDTQSGTSEAISIDNQTSTQFTTGISQVQPGGTVTPMCAFNLYGNHLDLIVPIEQVLLMFSTEPVDTGTVIEQAYSNGLLVDLTASNSRKVGYDINSGWTWGGAAWGRPVPPRTDLVPLLIQQGPRLQQQSAVARRAGLTAGAS
ncbi:MAG TPA: hypothetical protein VGL57_03385 [Solirubrobacteraceae bacterium]|jgi:hypothetical protein